MVRNHKTLFFILLILWFLVNLIQAANTEIISDEAYYGLYGKALAWGYFDHPPMVALLARISSVFFSGNLGIRFMTVLLQVFTLIIIWRIIDDRNQDRDRIYSFFIIAASICMFSVFGFITTPDVGLLFFASLFLYSYKKFLESQSWGNSFFLSVSMAGMVYSKYHAILVIGLIVISNLRLLGSIKFWIAGIFAIVLLSPHLLWQVTNDYPSIRYHLFYRPDGFKWQNILEYFPNQLLVFNPLVFGVVLYIMVKNKPGDLFNRGLYFLTGGLLCFFLLTSFRGHVEPHWTVSCSIPMIILLYNNSKVNPGIYRFLRKAILPSLLIIIVARVLLMTDLPPVKALGFSGKQEKYGFIGSVAKDMPVLFTGSYQGPSLYSFYTGKEASAINSIFSRSTQFDIWQKEKKYENKAVFICGKVDGRSQLYKDGGISFYGFSTDNLQTVNRITVKMKVDQKVIYQGDSLSFEVTFGNPYSFNIDFNHPDFPVNVFMALVKEREINMYPVVLNDRVGVIHSGEKITRKVSVCVPELPEGRYSLGVCLNTVLGPANNNSFIPVRLLSR